MYAQVRTWRPEPLYNTEMRLRAKASGLGAAANTFDDAVVPASWEGGAARAAAIAHLESRRRSRALVRSLNQVRDAVRRATDEVRDLTRLVAEAESVAAANEFVINDDGSVSDRGQRPPVPGGDAEDVNRELARKRAELTAQVTRLLTRAQEIDTTLTDAMRTATIVHRYQVESDAEGVTSTFGMQVTRQESAMLEDLSFREKLDFVRIHNEAFRASDTRFQDDSGVDVNGYNQDGREDAFRHAYWNALLTERFGAEWAERYTTAHEAIDGNSPQREAMDLYNNEVGREVALRYPGASQEQLRTAIELAVKDGRTVIIGSDQMLHPSDHQVP